MEKELIGKFDEVDIAMRDYEMEILALQEKTKQVQESLPSLQENIQKAEQEKTEALDDFCLDKCDQKTVDLKAESYDQTVKKEKSAREILEVLGRKEIAAQERFHRLNEQRVRIESQIWNFLYEESLKDTQAAVTKKLYLAFAINYRRLNSIPWESFLAQIKKPEKEYLEELSQKIDRLFQEAIGR